VLLNDFVSICLMDRLTNGLTSHPKTPTERHEPQHAEHTPNSHFDCGPLCVELVQYAYVGPVSVKNDREAPTRNGGHPKSTRSLSMLLAPQMSCALVNY
jgi:hypothetical protein